MKFIRKMFNKILPETLVTLVKLYYLHYKKINKDVTSTSFPLGISKNSYLNEPLFFKHNCSKRYYTQCYQEPNEPIPLEPYISNAMFEILPGHYVQKVKLSVSKTSVIPVSFQLAGDAKINRANGEKIELQGFHKKRFYYIKLSENDTLNIDQPVIIGEPIEKRKKTNGGVKLALCLFIDGLSNYLPNNLGLSELMPNTFNFFSKGIIFNNCYSNSEWSLPSLANMFTGQYTHAHKVFHPRSACEVGINNYIMSELFNNYGYLTLQVGANWRKAPTYGYVKGFDRTVYKRDMANTEVIKNFIEQVNSFQDREQFVWLDFFDLHKIHYAKNVPDISCQVNYSSKAHNYFREKEKSVFQKNDSSRLERYFFEVKRLDNYLRILYDYLENNYSDSDYLVIVCSDHGQSFLSTDSHILSDKRIKVPSMIRGNAVPAIGECEEIIENVDIFTTMLSLTGIDFDKRGVSGRLPKVLGGHSERKFAYSESIFPDRTFKASIRDKNNIYYFETENKVTNEGTVIIKPYKHNILGENNHKALVNEYKNYVLCNIEQIRKT